MMQPAMSEQQMAEAPPAVQENFYWMMSLALDGLLDEPDRAQFAAYQAQYPSLAALWIEWQGMDRQLDQMPHMDPAAGFVDRFELRLAEMEAAQQRRVLQLTVASGVLVAVLAIAACMGIFTYVTSTQGPWLGEQIRNLVYVSVAASNWFEALLDTIAALANTPQAQALGMMYVIVAGIMIAGWVQLLRRSARLATAGTLPGME